MKGHYLLLVLKDGKASVRREYVELLEVDETVEQATERWVEQKLLGRQRNRAKAGAALLNLVIMRRICRPSSWHRTQEAAPVAATTTRRRKR